MCATLPLEERKMHILVKYSITIMLYTIVFERHLP